MNDPRRQHTMRGQSRLAWDAELESIVASLTPAEIKAAIIDFVVDR